MRSGGCPRGKPAGPRAGSGPWLTRPAAYSGVLEAHAPPVGNRRCAQRVAAAWPRAAQDRRFACVRRAVDPRGRRIPRDRREHRQRGLALRAWLPANCLGIARVEVAASGAIERAVRALTPGSLRRGSERAEGALAQRAGWASWCCLTSDHGVAADQGSVGRLCEHP
jgi:hypothetical protein